jgi:hypothetical protein
VTAPDPNANKDPGCNLPSEPGFTGGLFSNLFGYKAERSCYRRAGTHQPGAAADRISDPLPNYPYGVGLRTKPPKTEMVGIGP